MTSPARNRFSLFACFLAGGLGIGVWGANMPALGRRAALSEGELGIVLLCFAAGAIVAMTNAVRLTVRAGALRPAMAAAAAFALGMAGVSLVSSMSQVVALAFFCGLSFGLLDVSMNNEAAAQEAAAGRPIMASFHALFSAGTLLGAAVYAGLIHAGWQARLALVPVAGAALLLALAAVALAGGGPGMAAPRPRAAGARVPVRPGLLQAALILGAMAFLAFLAEGALLDWAAVYLVRGTGSSEAMGAAGYAVFAGAMTLGRLFGDAANRRLGAVLLFALGAAVTAGAVALLLIWPVVPVILPALALAGLGTANVIPLLFSAAGRLGQGDGSTGDGGPDDGGRAMSVVLTMGYAGTLLGPAFIGFVAQVSSLRLSLATIVLASAVVALGAGRLRPHPAR